MTEPFKKTADVVIIGGGCNGTSTALHLAKRGVKNVVLLEKNYLASGATEDSMGNFRPYSTNEETVKLLQKGLETFKNFNQEIGGDVGFIQYGRLWAVPEERKATLATEVDNLQKWGVKIRMISPKEINELLPEANIKEFGAAAYFEEGANCDTVITTNIYAAKARELGVNIYEETEVNDIIVKGGKVQSVGTNQGEISTPVVVNAAGPWCDRIGHMVGIEIPISVQRQQSTVFRLPYDFPDIFPAFHDAITEWVYKPARPFGKHLIQIYPSIIFPPEVVDPDHYNDDVDPEVVTKAIEHAHQHFEILKRASYRGGATGLYDNTPDDFPVFGAIPEVEGFYCHCGWSGRGFQTSVVMGDLMAELITTGRTTFIDISLYRLSRFKEGKLLKTAWGNFEDPPE
jgi:sarcosine oxidase subunit beta